MPNHYDVDRYCDKCGRYIDTYEMDEELPDHPWHCNKCMREEPPAIDHKEDNRAWFEKVEPVYPCHKNNVNCIFYKPLYWCEEYDAFLPFEDITKRKEEAGQIELMSSCFQCRRFNKPDLYRVNTTEKENHKNNV